MKKVIKLINNERKNAQILSQKATGCITEDECANTSVDICTGGATDACIFIDAAHCSHRATDDCIKDYRACSFEQYDWCDYIDTSICVGASAEDYS